MGGCSFFFHKTKSRKDLKLKGDKKKGIIAGPPSCDAAEDDCWPSDSEVLSEGRWRRERGVEVVQQYSSVRVNQCYHDWLTGLTWLR